MCVGNHPFIPVSKTARLECLHSFYGQEVANILHFKAATDYDSVSITDLVLEAIAAWRDTVLTQLPVDIDAVTFRGVGLSQQPGPTYEQAFGTPFIGGLSGASLPANVTLCVSHRTGLTGASYRGRSYHLGLMENDVAANHVTDARRLAIIAAWTDFRDQMALGGHELAVVSYCNAGSWRQAGVATVVTSTTANTLVDTQRRRLG